ncbi:MAG: glycosyltransferase family 39 protein [Clostridia bacterium]|nr:glycosyltransferase family 39 protein [Clostridia bacterium]
MKNALGKYGILLLAVFAAWPVNTLAAAMMPGGTNLVCAFVCAAWLILSICLWRRKGWDSLAGIFAAAGFAAGLIFVLKLPHSFSWHDLAGYSSDFTGEAKPDGHLGYVAYLVEFGKLPLYDPQIEGFSVFFHPPLHHILHALCIKLNLALGITLETALENTQLITLAFASGCTLIALDLMRFLGVGRRGQAAGTLTLALQPSLLIFGATVNNDIQMTFLLCASLLFTVRWQRTRSMRDILLCGISLGLAMATKLSAALIIPCIAVVFATAFFRSLKQWKRYVGQFAAFLAVSVPEAIAWPVFHMIAYGMPFNYVRLPAETINVSNYTLWQRFGIPDSKAIRGLFYSGIRKIDHNVWMQTLKTGMFDEMTLFAEGTFMWYFAYMAMVLFAVLLLCSLVFFIRWLIIKNPHADGMTKGFLTFYGGMLIVNYLSFCMQYPYICTFNFRYILPVLLLCALALGALADRHRWIVVLPAGFAAMVCTVYGMHFFG